MRIVPGASPVCSATSLMLNPCAMGDPVIVTGTDDATAGLIPLAPRPSAQAAGNRDAIETQRLIQRDLAPFVRNGAASGTFPAIK